ncbi:hypothetical protein [Hyphococcus sp.]|uniref:hypothetical protein n=1 Tax=Hyphococcus sp. TaxID=2038636 RepID=UPI0035C67955
MDRRFFCTALLGAATAPKFALAQAPAAGAPFMTYLAAADMALSLLDRGKDVTIDLLRENRVLLHGIYNYLEKIDRQLVSILEKLDSLPDEVAQRVQKEFEEQQVKSLAGTGQTISQIFSTPDAVSGDNRSVALNQYTAFANQINTLTKYDGGFYAIAACAAFMTRLGLGRLMGFDHQPDVTWISDAISWMKTTKSNTDKSSVVGVRATSLKEIQSFRKEFSGKLGATAWRHDLGCHRQLIMGTRKVFHREVCSGGGRETMDHCRIEYKDESYVARSTYYTGYIAFRGQQTQDDTSRLSSFKQNFYPTINANLSVRQSPNDLSNCTTSVAAGKSAFESKISELDLASRVASYNAATDVFLSTEKTLLVLDRTLNFFEDYRG